MKSHGKTVAPRLPEAVCTKLKTGGNHKSKKDYSRRKEKANLRKLINDAYACVSFPSHDSFAI